MRSHGRLTFVALVVAAAALVLAAGATSKDPPPIIKEGSEVEVQLLALNDFHGNLLPPAGSSGRVGTVNAGGAEYLATHVRTLSETNRNTFVVSAGDLIGASPLLSALFHDEPTIEAMNMIGLDLNAVGNHEFDEGTTELLRMQKGGCHPVDGCLDGDGSTARSSSSSPRTSSTTTRSRRCSRRTRSSTSAARRSRSSA